MPCQLQKKPIFLVFILFMLFYVTPIHSEERKGASSFGNQDLLNQGPENIYKFAIELYKRGEYQKAKEKFLRVEQLKYDYKATRQFLNRLDQHLSFEQKKEQWQNKELTEKEEPPRTLQIEKRLREERMKEKDLDRQAKIEQRESLKKIELARKKIQKEKIRSEKQAKKEELEFLHDTKRKKAKLEKARREKERLALKRQEEEKKLLDEIRKREDMRYEKQLEFSRLLEEKRAALQERKEVKSRPATMQHEASNALISPKPPARAVLAEVREKPLGIEEEKEVQTLSLSPIDELSAQLNQAFSAQEYDLARDIIKRIEDSLAIHEISGAYEKELRGRMAYYARRIELRRQKDDLLKIKKKQDFPFANKPEVSGELPRSENIDVAKRSFEVNVAQKGPDPFVAAEKEELLKQRQHQRRKELLAEVDALYKKGMYFYKNGDFDAAREIFTQVDQFWPEYKLTRRYLSIVNDEATNKKVLKKALEVTAKKAPQKRSHVVAEALDAFEKNNKGD